MHRKDPDFSSLKALQHKIAAARSGDKKTGAGASPLGQATHIAVDLASGTVVGCGIGYALDQWLGLLPVCTLIGLCVGVAAGVKLMMRTLSELEVRLDNKPKENSDA